MAKTACQGIKALGVKTDKNVREAENRLNIGQGRGTVRCLAESQDLRAESLGSEYRSRLMG